MSVRVDLRGVNKKLSSSNLKRGRYAMANQMLRDMQPFVPNDQGILKQTGHLSSDGSKLIWNTPYAKAQYYGTNGKVVFRKYTTPGTGKRWDLKAKGIHMKDWEKVFVRGCGIK